MGHTGERSLAEIEVEDALINEAEEIDCEMVEAVAEIDDDEEEIPSSVKGIDEEESQLALSDNESEDDEIESEELDHFALVDKLNAVAAEGAILTGRGQEQSAGEDNLKSDIGDRVADSLAGDEADGLLDDASGIREQAEMEALICAPSMDINPVHTCSNAASIIIQDTRHHAESDHSKKKPVYNSFRASSYTPTPEPSQTLMPPVHATDPDSAIISIPLSKDGTFNEKDHPNLSQESLAKVHSALESCRKKGSKFPKRITIKREIVKKGGGHGGVVKRPVQR
ncbi:hypothetical protein BDR26DRAFT_851635 [Obelidium mucronatum]|nr:hypothetical protein BDR26DRAFT_851635 [Obelidium mucronatum]